MPLLDSPGESDKKINSQSAEIIFQSVKFHKPEGRSSQNRPVLEVEIGEGSSVVIPQFGFFRPSHSLPTILILETKSD